MLNSKLCVFALFTSITIPSSVISGTEWEATPYEGVWSGGYQARGQSLVLSLTIVDEYGELLVDGKNWLGGGVSARCHYQFAVGNGNVETSVLNQAKGNPEHCLPEVPFNIERTSLNNISLTPHQHISEMWQLDNFDLQAGLRPPLEEDSYVPIDNLDILGLTLEMPISRADQVLSERGFEAVETTDEEYEGFTKPVRRWGRLPGDDGEFSDLLQISYTAEADWITGEPVIARVERLRRFAPTDGMRALTVLESLEEKYGSGNRRGLRRWNRNGEAHSDYFCRESTHQEIPRRFRRINGNVEISKAFITCGPSLDAGVVSDRSTGLATSMSVVLTGVDGIWQEFWDLWSHDEAPRLEATYKSVTSDSGTGPEL